MFLKYITAALLTICVVYGIYALVTNLIGNTVDNSECDNEYCVFRNSSSDDNKFEPQIHQVVQVWLGLFFCIAWIFLLRVIKYFGRRTTHKLDDRFKTASDYAVKIENLPFGEYSEP